MMSPKFYSVDTTVLSGLPIKVEFNLYPPEEDVGIMKSYVSDIKLFHYKTGKPLGAWIYNRVMFDQKEFDLLVDKLYTHVACEDENFALELWEG